MKDKKNSDKIYIDYIAFKMFNKNHNSRCYRKRPFRAPEFKI